MVILNHLWQVTLNRKLWPSIIVMGQVPFVSHPPSDLSHSSVGRPGVPALNNVQPNNLLVIFINDVLQGIKIELRHVVNVRSVGVSFQPPLWISSESIPSVLSNESIQRKWPVKRNVQVNWVSGIHGQKAGVN